MSQAVLREREYRQKSACNMSSYDPPEEEEEGSSHDPGVKEKEITEERDFNDSLDKLTLTDYILYGVMLGLPAGALTLFLVLTFVPEFSETAEAFLQWLWDIIPVLWS
jgi:hypothetical protein